MTWTKLGDEFFDDCAAAGLSDAAVRTHAEAIGFLFRLESEGLVIQKHLLRRFAGSGEAEAAMRELVSAGFWHPNRKGWELVHHAEVVVQSLVAQQGKRGRDRRAQRAKRDRDGGSPVSGDVSADVAATQTDRQTGSKGGEFQSVTAVEIRPECSVEGCEVGLVGVERRWGMCGPHHRELVA